MELLAYIKELLLLNDCVIIPGFGGFVTNYKSATVQQARFNPPSKAISFNSKLKFNDGLLINHIAEKEGDNYLAISKKIDLLVQELNYRLTDGEVIGIDGVGELSYDENERLSFRPVLRENLNLDVYGLTSFSYETLYGKNLVPSRISEENRDVVQVFFQKRTLKKVLVAIPVVLALAFFPIKNNKENLQKSDLSSVTEMMTSRETVKAITPIVRPVEANPETQQAVNEHRYFIIGGSFRNENNAEKFIKQKEAQGFDARNIGFIKGLHYIALDSFETFSEAKIVQQKIKSESPGSGVWIYCKK
ncbi:MAG TPA: SPOR domain-containing protein [Sunxiuqinia sp.]|nr:SPOR domain-containing protein [Sunxiuqinia sp.]